MADIRLNGQNYLGVDKVVLPTVQGGTVEFGSGGSSFAPEYVSFSNYHGSVLNLTGLDTSNITDMSTMFWECSSLTTLDLSNFDTSNVTSMGDMFRDCYSLTTLTLPDSLDTSNVTTMDGMFSDCPSLTSLDLSNFNTSNVTSMGYVFSDCSSLTSLDLSNFNTSNVENMFSMFATSSSLSSLDIRNFSFNGLSDSSAAENMFYGISSTCVIYVNQAAYNFIAADFNDQNYMQLADLSMLQIVSNS